MAVKLNEDQKKAISAIDGNIAVIASAGSGKSTVLTIRIINMIKQEIDPDNILAITFSKSASDNMNAKVRSRIGNNKIPIISTVHSLGYRILKETNAITAKYEIASEYWIKSTIVDICINELGLFKYSSEVPYGFIKAFIDFQRISLRWYDDKLKSMRGVCEDLSEHDLYMIYKAYEENKIENCKIDFGDMLFKTYMLLRDNKDVREYYQDKFKYVLVDEAQDCNLLQFEMIKLINTNNVFMVGDFNQSIFGFAGSNPKFILDFKKHFKDAKYINLPINYRCSKNIVDNANKLINNAKESRHEAYIKAVANKSKFKDPELKFSEDPVDEAEDISSKCEELVKSGEYNYGDMAVLIRINAQSSIYQTVFYQDNIPFEIVGEINFFERVEIKYILNFLKVVHSGNVEAFKGIYNVPSRYLGKKFLNELGVYAKKNKESMVNSLDGYSRECRQGYYRGVQELVNIIKKVKLLKGKAKVGNIISLILYETGYKEYLMKTYNDESRMENINTLIFQANRFNDIGDFLDDVQKILDYTNKSKNNKKDGKIDTVKVMTLHKSKGLEFPIVFCIGMNEGLLPFHKADLAEERRLCYVGITRAEKELYLSSTESFNDRSTEPSSFLYEMFEEDFIKKAQCIKYKKKEEGVFED